MQALHVSVGRLCVSVLWFRYVSYTFFKWPSYCARWFRILNIPEHMSAFMMIHCLCTVSGSPFRHNIAVYHTDCRIAAAAVSNRMEWREVFRLIWKNIHVLRSRHFAGWSKWRHQHTFRHQNPMMQKQIKRPMFPLTLARARLPIHSLTHSVVRSLAKCNTHPHSAF